MTAPQQHTDFFIKARGTLEPQGSLADFIWFRTGGPADILFRPADVDDLANFMAHCPHETPVLAVGVGSNLLVRDGGVRGVVVRLPKSFSDVRVEGTHIHAGAAAMGITVASAARDHGVAGLEFLRGIPGTVGGAVHMNAGAYGRDIAAIFVSCTVVTRSGEIKILSTPDLDFHYRHSALPADWIVVSAELRGKPGDTAAITAEMDRIAAEREASQPLRSRTGGSTFKNPEGTKAWQLVDAAGCRGLQIGGAQVSEKHTNFLINTGTATAADIEALGETVRARVFQTAGVTLEWEIQRIGDML